MPTLQSALWQDYPNIEILVVGDGCDDDTHDVVAPYLSENVRWLNLPKRTGSQFGPNNVGIAQAQGNIIAYLGHDDIWAPQHVSSLVAEFSDPNCDFAVAGCIYYGPTGSQFYLVTGLFEAADAQFHHFFPPSSFAHRKAIVNSIGLWRAPNAIRPPVDSEFVLRAAHAGLTFSSTGRVSVHKFAAGHRYLSYLAQTSEEQAAMIARFAEDGFEEWLTGVVADAKRQGRFMIVRHDDYDRYAKGELAGRNRQNKGLQCPPLQELKNEACIDQTNEPRALDWYPLQPGSEFRWSGPSPVPRILIPYSGKGRVRFELSVQADCRADLENLTISTGGERLSWQFENDLTPLVMLSFEASLKADGYTILELNAPTHVDEHGRRVGIATGQIRLQLLQDQPLGLSALWNWAARFWH